MAYKRPENGAFPAKVAQSGQTIDVAAPAPALPPGGPSEGQTAFNPNGQAPTKKPGKPNPFKLDDFVGPTTRRVVVKKKANKEAEDLVHVVELEVVRGTKWGTFLSSGRDKLVARYSVNTRKEITGHVTRSPVANLVLELPSGEKSYLANLFKQVSQSGTNYMKGTNQDTGEVYLLFNVDEERAQ